MYLELWTIPVFAFLFGFCAWWNHRAGALQGIEFTVNYLCDQGFIKIINDGKTIVPALPKEKA